jgi:hypothetical protein
MGEAQTLEAKYRAQLLIADLWQRADVLRKLQEEFRCGPKAAASIYYEATQELREADEQERADRIAAMRASRARLYRKAFDSGKYSTCRDILADICQMDGLNAPSKVAVTDSDGNDLGQRSDADLDYFLEHGHYPEEAPKASKPQVPVDSPLDRLH